MEMLRYKIFSESKTISHQKPVIVMLHGLGGGYANWYGQIHALKPHYDLLLIELPSHGRSPLKMSEMEISYENLCKKIMEVVDHLGIEKAHFAGVSFGTMLVRYIILNYPDRVDKYIMAGLIGNFNFVLRTAINIVRYLLPIAPLTVVLKLVTLIVMPYRVSEYGRNVFMATAKRLTNKEFIAYCKLLSQFKNIQKQFVSTMGEESNAVYLVGELDYFFLLMLKKERERLKNMILVPNAGHICITDQADYCNRQILSFLETGEPVRGGLSDQQPAPKTIV